MAKDQAPEPKAQTLGFRILDTREQFQIDSTGRLVDMKVVYWVTELGDTGSVAVPKDQFTADLALAMVKESVAEVYKLRGV